MTGGERIWPVAAGVAWRVLRSLVRSPALVIPQLLFPLLFFTAFAGGLSQVAQVPGFDFPPGYTTFQFCFVLLQAAAFGGVFTGFGTARDFESGFGKRLLLSAPRRSGIVLGYALAAVARWAIVASVLVVVALVAGMRLHGGPVDTLGLFTLALFFNQIGFLWAAGIALRFRSLQAGPLMQMPVFLVLFFAPVYVPLDLLSGWLHAAATVNPATYALEAIRDLAAGTPQDLARAFGLAAAPLAPLLLWAWRGLRSAERAG
ncbi:MAG: ABC transporter permease [Gaiella sp.]